MANRHPRFVLETAGVHRTLSETQRIGVACDQACSGHVGVVSRDR